MVRKTFPPSFIGFETLFDELTKLSSNHGEDAFPRHNVVKLDEEHFQVELALAGYSESDVEVEHRPNGTLEVRGKVQETDKREYLFKGISSKKFHRTFRLAEHVQVDNAEFENGILTINLSYVVPEEKKPKLIPIQKPQLLTEG
jgi:molecular chaperone IbpA